MASAERLAELIDYHISDNKKTRKWRIAASELSGRGVFATDDIEPGEVIFREKPLLIGPSGRLDAKLNTCTFCYTILPEENFVCPQGCSLPVCSDCIENNLHTKDCVLYRKWEPVQKNVVDCNMLRILTVIRGLFLDKTERELLEALQANVEPGHKNDLLIASKSFNKFPMDDLDMLDYLHRIIAVLNTNAFQALSRKNGHEIGVRGLYPLCGIMNHICTPNTCHAYEGEAEMVVKATKHIPKGAELFTTYTKILWSNISRRIYLRITKHFACQCLRCADPTENGSYVSALLCRINNCPGWIIPEDSRVATSPWKCIKCNNQHESKQISKLQDFILTAMNSKTQYKNLKDIIIFINEKLPKLCPPQSQFVIEMKLNIIWRRRKSSEEFSKTDTQCVIRYCRDILKVLDKLEAGECTLKGLLLQEIDICNTVLKNCQDTDNNNSNASSNIITC